MRVIGGELGGRRLEAPAGQGTRPMLDRVREAVAASLAPWIDGARVLDLFAGTGSLGIEMLSRGAAEVIALERDRRAYEALLRNREALGLKERLRALRGDALDPRHWGGESFDIAFLDPPYPFLAQAPGRTAVFGALGTLLAEHMAPDGVAVLHAPRFALSEREFPEGVTARERIYGTTSIWFLGE